MPIPVSVLSDSNGLQRRFRVAESRNVHRATPEAAVDFAGLAFRATTSRKNGESDKESFAQRNERFRYGGRKSLISLWHEIGHFTRLFIFNDLTVVSLRAVARRRSHRRKAA
jgi:hypothetical protein